MARNGSGTYSLPAGNPVVTGTVISSTTMNSTLSDIATALTQSLAVDGQTTPTANIPLGNYKITTLGAGTATTDAANVGQIQSSAVQFLSGVSGVDTITAGISPTPAAYAAGQTFRFVSAGANTGAVTLNISSLGAKSVTKSGANALSAGDIPSGAVVTVTYDGTQFQIVGISLVGNGSVSAPSVAPSADTNTGIWFPAADTVAVSTGGLERMRVDSSGNVGVGTAAGTTIRLRVRGADSTASNYGLYVENSSAAGTFGVLNDGQVLAYSPAGIGYGTGAGGTVTQGSGSGKATAVTLNKPCGKITMDAAALNANTVVEFSFNNSLMSGTDCMVVTLGNGTYTRGAYVVTAYPGSGVALINVRNVTGGSLSEAVALNFAIIKGAQS